MSSPLTSLAPARPGARFEFAGAVRGFIRDARGKRRLLLARDGEELALKLPKLLRKRLADELLPGRRIAVTGIAEHDDFTGRSTLVISHVRLLGPPATMPSGCATCTIRICSKKNCWRNGGAELWSALEREIAQRDLAGAVRLKAVGCLGNCDDAPNLCCGRAEPRKCAPHRAASVLETLRDRLSPHSLPS